MNILRTIPVMFFIAALATAAVAGSDNEKGEKKGTTDEPDCESIPTQEFI